MDPPPVENIATGLVGVKADGYLRTDRHISLIQHDDIPGGFCLDDGKVILAAGLAGDDGIAVPLVVADQSHTGQGIAICIRDVANNVSGGFGTARAGMRRIGLGGTRWQKAISVGRDGSWQGRGRWHGGG